MRVAVTGASGFIGIHVVSQLLADKHEVLEIVGPNSSLTKSYSDTKLSVNLINREDWAGTLREFQPEVLIHLAWEGLPHLDNVISEKNLNMSKNFLQHILEITPCRKILIAGSCLEYGIDSGECFPGQPIVPKTSFAKAKNELREWIFQNASLKGISVGWLRIFYVYGPGQRRGALLPTILSSLKAGRIPELRTPNLKHDFIFIKDIARGFSNAVTSDFGIGIYNLGSGIPVMVSQVALVSQRVILGTTGEQLIAGSDREIEFEDVPEPEGLYANYVDTEMDLGWRPECDLYSGIRATYLAGRDYQER